MVRGRGPDRMWDQYEGCKWLSHALLALLIFKLIWFAALVIGPVHTEAPISSAVRTSCFITIAIFSSFKLYFQDLLTLRRATRGRHSIHKTVGHASLVIFAKTTGSFLLTWVVWVVCSPIRSGISCSSLSISSSSSCICYNASQTHWCCAYLSEYDQRCSTLSRRAINLHIIIHWMPLWYSLQVSRHWDNWEILLMSGETKNFWFCALLYRHTCVLHHTTNTTQYQKIWCLKTLPSSQSAQAMIYC